MNLALFVAGLAVLWTKPILEGNSSDRAENERERGAQENERERERHLKSLMSISARSSTSLTLQELSQ